MGVYPLEQIIQEWRTGRLTEEQVIGQILLLIQDMRQRLAELERKLTLAERVNKG